MPSCSVLSADRRAVVVDAVGDDRPAVVAPGLDAVELVAAARAVLRGPELARHRVEREPLGVAVAVAPDAGESARAPHEGVVLRHAAVVEHAVDLPARARRGSARRPAARGRRSSRRGAPRDRRGSACRSGRWRARRPRASAGTRTPGRPRRRPSRARARSPSSRSRPAPGRSSRGRSSRSARSRGGGPRRAARRPAGPRRAARRESARPGPGPASRMRSRPGRSLTSMRPSGRNSRPHGVSSPSATVSSRKACRSLLRTASNGSARGRRPPRPAPSPRARGPARPASGSAARRARP